MAYTPWQRYITDGGSVIPGADVEVRLESNGALATIYDSAGGASKSNPFQADSTGLARFYAAAGLYKIEATDGNFTATFRNEPIGEAQGYDVGDTTSELLLTRSMLDARFYPNRQDNLSGSSAPTASDDSDSGYEAGSLWIDTSATPTEIYRCVDASVGAAVWKNTSLELSELGSAATKDVGTNSTEVPQNSDLGTASTKDVGTASTEVPQNSDLGSMANRVAGTGAQEFRDNAENDSRFLAAPGTSSDPALAFDTWRTPNASSPVMVQIESTAETDGTTVGTVKLLVDEDGGTTADYTVTLNTVDPDVSSSVVTNTNLSTAFVPVGGSYQVSNASDPNSGNAIASIREFVL